MHLAWIQGVPVLALFGPTDPALNAPWGAGHVVLDAAVPRTRFARASSGTQQPDGSLGPQPSVSTTHRGGAEGQGAELRQPASRSGAERSDVDGRAVVTPVVRRRDPCVFDSLPPEEIVEAALGLLSGSPGAAAVTPSSSLSSSFSPVVRSNGVCAS